MKLRGLPATPPEPSEGAIRRLVPRGDRRPDPALAEAVRLPTVSDRDFDSAALDASPMQTAVALSVLGIGDAIGLLESAPHHARGASVTSGRERLRAFLAANGLERLDVRRDGLLDRALAGRIPTESLLRLGALHPVEDHDEELWLEAARIWSVPNLTLVVPPDGSRAFPFWQAALRGEISAGDLLTAQDSTMGIRRATSYSVYRALCSLKEGALPYSAEALRTLVAVAADAEEFRLGEAVIAEYGALACGHSALDVYPHARGRTAAEFSSVAAYAKKAAKLVTRDEWALVVALHDAGLPAEDLVSRLRRGEAIRTVAAELLDNVPSPLSGGWL